MQTFPDYMAALVVFATRQTDFSTNMADTFISHLLSATDSSFSDGNITPFK